MSVFSAVRDLERLRQITMVLVRHGFGALVRRIGLGGMAVKSDKDGDVVNSPMALRLRLVFEELGPTFVKLGQILSTRPDLIPSDFIDELKKLQDSVPPVSYESVAEVIESELGKPIAELFVHFDENPLASASIGQVHRAQALFEGEVKDVVVKVQRPNIQVTIERDLDLLYRLASALESGIPESRIYSPVKMVAEFDRAIRAELDYQLEADNAQRFTKNFAEDATVIFPEVYRELSARRVLTMTFLDGRKIFDAVAQGANGELITKRALGMIVKQIFEDGFFHADPHPGNVIILGSDDDPVLGMIDLGLVGRLTPELRDRTLDLMVACAREDRRGVADALYAIGRPTKKIDRQAYEAEVSMLADKYLGKPLKEVELSSMVRDLVGGAVKYGLEIPAEFLMVGKTLVTVEGVGKVIYPDLDLLAETRPYFLKLAWSRYAPDRIGEDLLRGATRLGGVARDLPFQLQDILEEMRRGSLSINIAELNIPEAAERLGKRLFSGLLVSALTLGGAYAVVHRSFWLGFAMLGSAVTWGGFHMSLLILSKRFGKKRVG